MKILHFFNPAAVASVLAKYTDKIYGTESNVVMTERWDKRVRPTYYGEVWDTNKYTFAFKFLYEARRYDIIHVHYHDNMLMPLRQLYNKKGLIMHYHGTDIRDRWESKFDNHRFAKRILVSTPDLLDGSDWAAAPVEYLPNPVDTELFYNRNEERLPTALHFQYHADELAKEYTDSRGLDLETLSRGQTTPHLQMPQLLNQYEYYIDVKRNAIKHRSLLEAMSKTGLEALACGCKVIRWDGKIIEGLPDQHRPENVVKRLHEIYQEVA